MSVIGATPHVITSKRHAYGTIFSKTATSELDIKSSKIQA